MTEQQRKYLVALAAEAATNPEFASSLPAGALREMILAIDEEMGRPSDASIVVDALLADMRVRWIPEA